MSGLEVHREPAFESSVVEVLGRDLVLPIAREVTGEVSLPNPYNDRWFEVEAGGYA